MNLLNKNDVVEPVENEIVDIKDLPWLIFTLSSNCYAINSKFVNGILMPPETTPLPEAPDIYKGLIEIRGEVFPLLEMRKLFHFKSIEAECSGFEDYLNKFKDAHINWVNSLKNCVEKKEKFMLETDPTKCAFGKWYHEYMKTHKSDNSVNRALLKIDAPHRLLHESAITIRDLMRDNSDGVKDADIIKILNTCTEDFMPLILGLMNEAIQGYKDLFREVVVHLSNGQDSIGLLVDEVLAIDSVEIISNDSSMNKIVNSHYFSGVAHNSQIKKEILIIDEELLLSKAKV